MMLSMQTKFKGEVMKKKVLSILVMFLCFAGVVSASSLNGDYKGNPIVKLKSNGSLVDTGEVPAVIYDGSTLVPIAALRNLGADVIWDAETYSVDVKLKQPSNLQDYKTSDSLKDLKAYDVALVSLSSGLDGLTNITYYYNGTSAALDTKKDQYTEILRNSTKFYADITEISYVDGTIFSVPTNALKDFFNGNITADTLIKYYKLTSNQTITPNSTPSGTNQAQQQQQTQSSAPQSSAPVDDNSDVCKNLIDDYNLKKVQNEQLLNPFNGFSQYTKDTFEQEADKTFAQFGCTKPKQ